MTEPALEVNDAALKALDHWTGISEGDPELVVRAIAAPVVIAELDRLRRGMVDPSAYSRLSARIEELEQR